MKSNPIKVVAGTVFLVVVAAFCLLTVKDLIVRPLDYFRSGIVFLGLLGAVLYMLRVRLYALVLWSWIFVQMFKLEKMVDNQVQTIANFQLSISYPLDVDFIFQGISYVLSVNLIPLLFIPFMFALPRTRLIGEEFMLKPFRENDWLAEKVPQAVKVLDVLNFSGNTKWVLVHLSKSISYGDTKYFHALVKAKDYVRIEKRSARQIVHFRLFDGHKHPEKSLKEFPFIDWVVLE